MEYKAAKLHQVENALILVIWCVWKHDLFTVTQLKLCERILYASFYAAKTFLYDK